MSSYSVNVTVDDKWVDNFNSSGMRLCMAKATKDDTGKEVYNVIVKTVDKITPNMKITWTEEYQIQASPIVFNKGAKVMGTTNAKSINFGETYNAASWTKIQIFPDPQNVDNRSIGFNNEMPCSIVLSIRDGNVLVPVYVSPFQVPPGSTTLTPIPKVVFWFQNQVTSSTMIKGFPGKTLTVSPQAGQTAHIKYDDKEVWSIMT